MTQAQLDLILQELEPELRQALLDAFADMRAGVDMRALRDAVEAGDVAAVERALNADEGSFAPYVLTATMIFLRYGAAFAPTLGRGVRFNATLAMPSTQQLIAENVRRMTEETRQMARELTVQGIGRRNVARQIREGIGLTIPQAGYVESMRQRLQSNDPAQLRAILKGQMLRDKRYDATIKRAIKTGEAIPETKIREMTDAYTRKLRRKRAEDMAAAEAQQFAERAKFEAASQAGGVIEKTWRHSRIYLRARPDHVSMSGTKVIGLNTPFMVGGTPMQYAHDPAGGARNNANCRCSTKYRLVKDD